MTTAVLWFRRDLRLADHPALLAARDEADDVLPLFVLDDVLRGSSGAPRLAFLYRCLRELEERTDGRLRVLHGRPEEVVPRVAQEVAATGVHVSSDFGPYGRERDARVRVALGDVPLVATGSPYGVPPGQLLKADGTPFRVYSPFARAWRARGLPHPAPAPRTVRCPTSASAPRRPAGPRSCAPAPRRTPRRATSRRPTAPARCRPT